MRARQAAGIEPRPGPVLRDADELLVPDVRATIEALGLADSDSAAAKLALRYAQVIDKAADPGWAMRWIGPLLLGALVELEATPKSRPQPVAGPRPVSRLDRLRESHAATYGTGG